MQYIRSYFLKGPLGHFYSGFDMDLISSQQKKHAWEFSIKSQQTRRKFSSRFEEIPQRQFRTKEAFSIWANVKQCNNNTYVMSVL